MTIADFAANFFFYIMDESVFYFGSTEQQEVAKEHLLSVQEAIKACVYGKDQLPVATQ